MAEREARPAADNLQAGHAQRDAGHLGSLGVGFLVLIATGNAGVGGQAWDDSLPHVNWRFFSNIKGLRWVRESEGFLEPV